MTANVNNTQATTVFRMLPISTLGMMNQDSAIRSEPRNGWQSLATGRNEA